MVPIHARKFIPGRRTCLFIYSFIYLSIFIIFRDKRERWKRAGLPPHGITPVKGGIHVVLNRQFVDFAINSKVAKDLLNWCRKVQIPDELYFPTLNNNPQLNIPGSYKGLLFFSGCFM